MSAPLTWTCDRPTVEGFFWMRLPGYEPEVVEALDDDYGGLFIDGLQTYGPLVAACFDGASWAGPLPEPTEGA